MLVTTAGGVEEDLIKCLAPTYIGDFSLRGQDLRQSGINRYGAPGSPPGHWGPLPGLDCPLPRIGNLLVPNDNYCKFEDWLMPILEQMVDEQETQVGGGQPRRLGLPRLGGGHKGPSRLGPCWLGVLSVVVRQGVRWTPSRMIARLGKEINNPESVCYWAQKVGGDGGGGHRGCHRPSPPPLSRTTSRC